MNNFTASNGVTIFVREGGTIQALREFFQAEADERLGRWRWPEDADFVVYEPREGQPARVLRESTGQIVDFLRSASRSTHSSAFKLAARAYFDAHPEPKPWHEAVEGQVWILMFANSSHAWFVNGDYFQSTKTLTNIAKTDEGIIAGRCIFPEEVPS